MNQKTQLPATRSAGLHRVTRAPTLTTKPDTQLAADRRTLGRFRNSSVRVLQQTWQSEGYTPTDYVPLLT